MNLQEEVNKDDWNEQWNKIMILGRQQGNENCHPIDFFGNEKLDIKTNHFQSIGRLLAGPLMGISW